LEEESMMSNPENKYPEERWSETEAIKRGLIPGATNRVTLHRWRRAKKIGFYKCGSRIFYGRHHIEEFLARCERQAKKADER
jgi:hypothetical protein